MSDYCPTCGSKVTIHTGDEGTSSYTPQESGLEALEADSERLLSRDMLQFELDRERHNHNADNTFLLRERERLVARLREFESPGSVPE